MSIDLVLITELLALGLFTGFLAGLLGIGGGSVLVPAIAAILTARGVDSGIAVKMAIATSMAIIVFTSMSSVRAHHRHGAVRWDIVKTLTPGIIGGAMVASLGLFTVLQGAALYIVFAAFVTFTGSRMLSRKAPAAGRGLPGTPGLVGMGGAIGFLSGLVGAGGGFISVPFLTWSNVSMHAAVATSAALGFPIALSNVIGYILAGQNLHQAPPWSFGYLWLPALLVISICSMVMAPMGARAAHALPVDKLRKAFAGLLFLLAIYMLEKGVQAMLA